MVSFCTGDLSFRGVLGEGSPSVLAANGLVFRVGVLGVVADGDVVLAGLVLLVGDVCNMMHIYL